MDCGCLAFSAVVVVAWDMRDNGSDGWMRVDLCGGGSAAVCGDSSGFVVNDEDEDDDVRGRFAAAMGRANQLMGAWANRLRSFRPAFSYSQ